MTSATVPAIRKTLSSHVFACLGHVHAAVLHVAGCQASGVFPIENTTEHEVLCCVGCKYIRFTPFHAKLYLSSTAGKYQRTMQIYKQSGKALSIDFCTPGAELPRGQGGAGLLRWSQECAVCQWHLQAAVPRWTHCHSFHQQ